MKYNKITLSFSNKEESLFREEYFQGAILQFRIVFVLLIFLYGVFGYLDTLIIPEYERVFHIIRFIVVIPVLSFVLAISFTHLFKKIWQTLIFICLMVGGFGISIMTMLAPENYAYYAGMMLIFSAGYFFIKLRFFMATIAGWLILLSYNMGAVLYAQTPSILLIANNFFFVSANLIGMFAAYNTELYLRRNFFLSKKLESEKLLVSKNNENLETIINIRTKELLNAKERAEESEARYRLIADNTSDSIWVMDADLRFNYLSPSTEKLFGYSFLEWETLDWNTFVNPDYMETVLNAFGGLKSGKQENTKTISVIVRHKNGTEMCIEFSANPLFDENGVFTGAVGITRDITERKQAEQALKESEEKFRTYIMYSPTSIFIADRNGKYIFANPAACKLMGYSNEEILKLTIPDITPKNLLQKGLENFLELQTKGYTNNFEIELKKKDGTLVDVILDGVKLSDNEYIAFIKDITELKNTQLILQNFTEELQKLNSDKDRFLKILAHDLINPFNSILGFSNLLIENIGEYDKEKIEKQLRIINHITHKTYHLLEDLLSWTNSQSGKLTFEPKTIDLNEICNEQIEHIKFHADTKSITLNFFEPETISIYADVNMLKTVLRNLILNAVKFTNRNGQINIYAEKNHKTATITISDNGIGIEKENIPKLWDIAEKHSTTGTEGETGTGLGLILCKEFVEKHGSKIWVESEVGKGSNFKFTLPLSND